VNPLHSLAFDLVATNYFYPAISSAISSQADC